MKPLKWTSHADLAICRSMEVDRREYLDHRIPNGTPLENYRFYIDSVWQMFEAAR